MRSTPERRRFHRPWPSSACSVPWTWVFLALCIFSCVSTQEYVVPQATLEAITPRGLRVSIPDTWGVQLFAFHGNINKPMRNLEAGELSVDVTRKTGDRWVYINDRVRLKIGDVINYWIYVKVDGLGYRLDDQSWTVVELVSADSPVGSSPTFTLLPSSNTEGSYTRPSSTGNFGSSSNFGGSESISNSNYPGSSSSSSSYPGTSIGSSNYPGTSTGNSNYPGSGSNSNTGSFGAPTNPSINEGFSNSGGSVINLPNNRPSSSNSRPTSTNSRPTITNNRPTATDYTTSNFGSNSRPIDTLNAGDYGSSRPMVGSSNRPTHSNNRPTDTDYSTSNFGSNNRPIDTLSNGDFSRPTNRPTSSNNRPADTDYSTSNFGSNNRPIDTLSNGDFSRPTNRPTSSNNRPTDTDYSTSNFGSNNRPIDTLSNGDFSRPTNRPTSSNNRPTDTDNRPTNSFGGSSNRPIDTLSNGDFGGSRPSGNVDTVNNYDRPKPAKPQTSRPPTPAPAHQCVLSTTTVNGQPACKNHVIFEETFRNLDLRRWSRDIRIPSHPDFEFCVFSDEPDTLWVQNDALHLRPRLTEDRYGEDFVRTGNLVLNGCTAGPTNAESCSRQAVFSYILPPTLSSRVSTKDSFRFRYGLLEIRAKMPLGDWIYPEILLLPYAEHYGPGITSGRVQLAMSRGNRLLSYRTGTQLGAKRLEYGVMAGTATKILHRDANRQWADQFHNYSLLWTPETMAFSVDGVELGIIRPESYGGLLRSDNSRDPWSNGDVLAPFDKEFYLSLGLAVGGVRTFPDDIVTGGSEGYDKPWGNTDAKAMLRFWTAKEQWYPTWGNRSEFIIESIRVTALNH